ncbi:MAG TPA: prolyl oligopeptidase family serine peptidase [Gemmatimonadaceae bacterium]|nr:prolyl oligopeptidase family serine peptidase [Gemmatimonadaceae bacterium]
MAVQPFWRTFGLAFVTMACTSQARTARDRADTAHQAARTALVAPLARRGNDADVYHGVAVADPYRWMEEARSPAVRSWIEEQDRYARAFAAQWAGHDSARAAIARGTVSLISRAPIKEGGRYFYGRSRGAGPSLAYSFFMRTARDAAPRTVIDGDSLWAADAIRIRRAVPSADGLLAAYGVTRADAQIEQIRVREIDTGRDLRDRLEGMPGTGSLVWARRGSPGFFYTRFTPPERIDGGGSPDHPRIMFHRLGAPQAQDEVVFERPDHPEWVLRHSVSDDGCYLVIAASIGVERRDRIFVRDLTSDGSSVVPLIEQGDAEFVYVGNAGHTLWFQTDFGAPRRRVIAIDLASPQRKNWRNLIPEGRDAIDTWIGARAVGGGVLVAYRTDAVLGLHVFDSTGRFQSRVVLPQRFNSMWTLAGRQGESEVFYVLQGVADPGTVYSLDMRTGKSTEFARPSLPYDPKVFITEQVFYASKDGTRVPMYVVRHKGTRLDGSAPGMIYGYGFDAWAGSPWFQPMVTEWMREGGLWALANIRGGGEYGSAWAEAGRRRRKQTSIDDYLAAAEWLQAHHYVAGGRLVANSGSAGGMIAAAAIQQRPDLFAASILDYPVIDMFRYHLYSGGSRWTQEYGTVNDSADFAALRAYSPYHNLHVGTCYPPTMLSPGELDQTAVPMHAYKFAAALQFANVAAPGCANVALLRVSWGAGHSAGATPEDQVATWADQLAFLARVLGSSPNATKSSAR